MSVVRSILSHRKIAELFAIDLRALAALRIGLALILLFDLARRAPYIVSHYSGLGAMPREALKGLSLHALNGSPIFIALLFLIAAVFAVMLLIGYHTWLATALSWFLLASLQMRNMLVNNSGDHLLSLLLFWGMFLPLGAVASVDSRISKPRSPVPKTILCVGGVALMLQVMYPYVFSALLKNHHVWVNERLAIYNSLNLDAYAKPAGQALLQYPWLIEIMSPLTYWYELYGPFFAFVPFFTPWFRGFTALSFIGFHAGLQMTFELNLFAYVCIVMWLVFFPQGFWERLARLRPAIALSRWGGGLVDRIARLLATPLREQPWLAPPPDDGRATRPGNVLSGVLVVYLLAWNIGTVYERLQMPVALRWPGAQLYIGQKWQMFKTPPLDDGWWLMPASLRDGSEVDLFTDASPVRREKPPSVLDTFSSPRWRRMLENYWNSKDNRDNVVHYAAWRRNQWNSSHPPDKQIEAMQIYYVVELTRPDYKPPIRSDQLIYGWNSSGEEHVPTYRDSLRSLVRDVGGDPEVRDDIVRSLGLEKIPGFND